MGNSRAGQVLTHRLPGAGLDAQVPGLWMAKSGI
jgi:hypothetical protein